MKGTVEHKMKGNHHSQVWFNFVRWFQRRGFKCESIWRTTDNKHQVMRKAHLAWWAKNGKTKDRKS